MFGLDVLWRIYGADEMRLPFLYGLLISPAIDESHVQASMNAIDAKYSASKSYEQ